MVKKIVGKIFLVKQNFRSKETFCLKKISDKKKVYGENLFCFLKKMLIKKNLSIFLISKIYKNVYGVKEFLIKNFVVKSFSPKKI